MNQWDKDNLYFIMNASDEEFREWMDQATQDDINYALQLIAEGKRERYERQKFLEGIAEWEHYPEVVDFTEANNVLNKFMMEK